jgi:Domain of unknown function (DUF5658)
MAIEFTCALCGGTFSLRDAQNGSRARCPGCEEVQRISLPERASAEPGTYDMAPPPILPQEAALTHAVSPSLQDRRTTSAWMEAVRSWALETSHIQGVGFVLVLLSIADLLMTFALLRTSHTFVESNPVASWFFTRWDMTGMVIFKFSVIGGVIAVAEFIERRRPGWGQFVLLIGCVGAAYAFLRGLSLYLGIR